MATKRKGSPFYWYDFKVDGERFSGSTGCTSKREAEAVEAAARLKAKAAAAAGTNRPRSDFNRITVEDGFNRWLDDRQADKKNYRDALHDAALCVTRLGATRRFVDITDNDVAKLVRQRKLDAVHRGGRAQAQTVAKATVNRSSLQRVRAAYLYLMKLGMRPDKVPDWKAHRVKEGKAKNREIRDEDLAAILAEVRDDYRDYIDFARLSGQRQMECVLRWTEVNEQAGTIELHDGGKGDEPVSIPITPVLAGIIARQRGRHPVWVFTYVCKRTRKTDGHIRGVRYPMTRNGICTEWTRARAKAGCTHVRFHDLRHNFGSKMMREHGSSPRLVQMLMNHRDVATTMRYVHATPEEAVAAVAAFQKRESEKSHNKSHTGLTIVGNSRSEIKKPA